MKIIRGIEKWKPVVGYESVYEVSTWGRLRRISRSKGRIGILRGGLRKDGYINVVLADKGTCCSRLVHQIVADAFIGPCPDGKQINHRHPDGNRARNWLSNLEYVSSGINNADQRKHRPANYALGPDVPNCKLTLPQVIQIKIRIANGESDSSIARDYAVHSRHHFSDSK